jgi:hypothetical protein
VAERTGHPVSAASTLSLRRARRALVALTSTALALTGCTLAPPAATPSKDDAVLGHIHALDYDPATNRTYASAHNGVWLVPTADLPSSYPAGDTGPDHATQIAGRAQDTMGFTVARPGLLLASGHPDPAQQAQIDPPNLGLISSIDGAETWMPVSLRGETDFHDLEAVELGDGQLRVYGHDAADATILVSNDSGKTWSRSSAIQGRDLAVDPQRPDRLYATTAEGLLRSDDAGATFTPVPGAPALFLVTVTDVGEIIGISPDGVIHIYDGTTWSERGRTDGTPDAFTYVGGAAPWLLIADQRGLVATADYGVTVTTLLPMAG